MLVAIPIHSLPFTIDPHHHKAAGEKLHHSDSRSGPAMLLRLSPDRFAVTSAPEGAGAGPGIGERHGVSTRSADRGAGVEEGSSSASIRRRPAALESGARE